MMNFLKHFCAILTRGGGKCLNKNKHPSKLFEKSFLSLLLFVFGIFLLGSSDIFGETVTVTFVTDYGYMPDAFLYRRKAYVTCHDTYDFNSFRRTILWQTYSCEI